MRYSYPYLLAGMRQRVAWSRDGAEIGLGRGALEINEQPAVDLLARSLIEQHNGGYSPAL